MAFNSRERRASAGACGLLSLVLPPIPDGTIGAPDRLQLLGFYSGIAAGSPAAIPDYVPPPVGTVAVFGRPTGTVQGPSGS